MTASKMPLISAVTPCLNDAVHLPEMIESFLAQDYPHKELFVQDGGSSDGTHEILRRYPIRWTVAPDSGPHDAINKAILASRGDAIVVMPANDFFAPGAFSRAAEELCRRPNLIMVYGDCGITDDAGNITRIDRPGVLDIDRLFWLQQILLQSSYIRRKAFERVGLFDPAIIGPGDTDWLMRVVAGYPSESFFYVPETWSSFRFGQNLTSYRYCLQSARVLLAAHERFLSTAENCRRLRHGEARARAGMQCQCASWLSRAGRPSEAWKRLGQGFRQWPGLIFSSLGLNYTLRVLLGRNLERIVGKYVSRIRAAVYSSNLPKRSGSGLN